MKKFISIVLLLLIVSCVKDDILDYTYYTPQDIFEAQGGVLRDASLIEINLEVPGRYIISLQDEFTSKVVTKELFIGNKGVNTLHVFTKIVPKGSYNLVLTDKDGKQVQQTKISI
jgi:hypothetical protein